MFSMCVICSNMRHSCPNILTSISQYEVDGVVLKVQYNAIILMEALTIFHILDFNSLGRQLANLESFHQVRNEFLDFLS